MRPLTFLASLAALTYGGVAAAQEHQDINDANNPLTPVWHDGVGAPRWQILAGISFQFPIRKPAE